MRWFGWVVALAPVLVAPACAPHPVAPLRHVSETHALRVTYGPDRAVHIDFGGQLCTGAEVKAAFDSAEDALTRFNTAFGDTLRRAGYQVTDDGSHDVRIVRQLYFAMEPREARHNSFGASELVRVDFHLYARDGGEIDRFELRSNEAGSPLGPSESIAVDLVNLMVESPKLSAYAEAR